MRWGDCFPGRTDPAYGKASNCSCRMAAPNPLGVLLSRSRLFLFINSNVNDDVEEEDRAAVAAIIGDEDKDDDEDDDNCGG